MIIQLVAIFGILNVILAKHKFSLKKDMDAEKIEKLREYKKLLDEGILNQEEFDKRKAEILNK